MLGWLACQCIWDHAQIRAPLGVLSIQTAHEDINVFWTDV